MDQPIEFDVKGEECKVYKLKHSIWHQTMIEGIVTEVTEGHNFVKMHDA